MCSQKEKHELDRRAFLKRMMTGGMAVASNPLQMMLANYFTHFMSNGLANAAGVAPFNDAILINVVLEGGCSRWAWDYSMTPNGASDPFLANPMVINRFIPGPSGKLIGEYKTVNIGGVEMPYLWSARIPTSNGGSVPMSELANHLFSMYGINTGTDGHGPNTAMHMAPTLGVSISGIVSDAATTPMPALNIKDDSSSFKAPSGSAEIKTGHLGGSANLTSLLAPFTPVGGNISNMLSLKSSTVENALDNFIGVMKSQSSDIHKFLPSTYQTAANAKNLIKKNFGNLQTVYNALEKKYTNLMQRALTDRSLALAGLDDAEIPGDPTGKDPYFAVNGTSIYSGKDLRTLTNSSTYIFNLAQGMAITEFMITNQLSSTVSTAATNMVKAAIDAMVPKGGGSTSSNLALSFNNDIHDSGAYISLLYFSKYFTALSACLYELFSVLKATSLGNGKTMFDNMTCVITDDFNRSARMDGTGADHGFNGSCYTAFSGKITKGPIVVGNTTFLKTGGYAGSWGIGAPVPEFSNRIAHLGNAVSTVAQLIGVKSPVPNEAPFATVNKGSLVLAVKKATVIAP